MTATTTDDAADLDEEPRGLRRWLPAPPSPLQALALGVAACFLAGVVGWRIAQPDVPARGSVDVGALVDMRAHHEQAIVMAQIEMAQGDSPQVKLFADEILRFQSYEIGLMDQMLYDWGYEPEARDTAMAWMGHPTPTVSMGGMATDAELDALRGARGEEADAIFLDLMQEHHRGALGMATYAARNADDRHVRELMGRIAKVQRAEIGEMAATVERLGLDPTPLDRQ